MTRKPATKPSTSMRFAVIYCRVSSKKQEREGDGLNSQELRLKQWAAAQGLTVVQVFRDNMTGKEGKRPGLLSMLSFIDADPSVKYTVIFDHLDRWVRDYYLHADLRRTIDQSGHVLQTPGMTLDDRSSSRLMAHVTVAFSDYHRRNNAEQTLNRMQARLQNGFAVFAATAGYTYGRVPGLNGKVLVRDEPVASIVVEALEGYACGRFETQANVQRFLEAHPLYPKPETGKLPHQRISDMLRNCIYASDVEAPSWDIPRRKGHHEALITRETHQRIQDRLNGLRAAYRTDLSADFPLRGSVDCDDCGGMLTACWSTSGSAQKKRHPYYQCPHKGCASYGKPIRRDLIEGEFEALLHQAQPRPQVFRLAAAMMKELWDRKQGNVASEAKALRGAHTAIEKQVETYVERIVAATVPAVARAMEKKVEQLEAERLLIEERIAKTAEPRDAFEPRLRTALAFIANPWNLWNTGRPEDRRAVLKLTFADKLRYKRGEGFRTANLALPFKVLRDFLSGENEVARRAGR